MRRLGLLWRRHQHWIRGPLQSGPAHTVWRIRDEVPQPDA